MTAFVDVKPELLKWAFERSRLPISRFNESLTQWMEGDKRPTLRQLEAFAKRAMVPIGYLFLDMPPNEELPVPDYRTRLDEPVKRPGPNLIETVFQMQQRQEWLRETLIDEGHEPLPFVASAAVNESIPGLASEIRETLGFTADWSSHRRDQDDAHRYLRKQIEAAGIFIFCNGIVGNNTRRALDPGEFQGFVLVDDIAPLIFVNSADVRVAQMFTIAHELAHVWIGQSSLFTLDATLPSNLNVELYCNSVAAEILVPQEVLRSLWPREWSANTFVELGRHFKVSPIVIARCAKDSLLVPPEAFFSFYKARIEQERRLESPDNDGGNFWNSQNTRLGSRFPLVVIAAAESGMLSYSDAYDLTQLYGDSFDTYVDRLRSAG